MHNWKHPEYLIIRDKESLLHLKEEVQKRQEYDEPIIIDIETTGCFSSSGLNYYYGWLLGVSICFDQHKGYYIPLNHTKDKERIEEQVTVEEFKEILGETLSNKGLYIGHNIKFDYKFLYRSGIELYPRFWDTSIAVQLINGNTYAPRALKEIIKDYLNVPLDVVRSFSDVSNEDSAETPIEEMAIYAINDVIFTYYVFISLKPIIDNTYYELFYNIEAPLVPILAQMEMKGIRIDVEYFKRLREPLEKYQNQIAQWVEKKYKVNINSTQQLGKLYAKKFSNVFLKKTKAGNISTDVESLQIICRNHKPNTEIGKLSKRILTYREVAKQLNTYIDKFPHITDKFYDRNEEIIHTDFDQIKNSGRLSSSPNIQNIPRKRGRIDIRKGFIARDGYKLIEADWSSAELRLVTIFSNEPKMRKAYEEDPINADLHALTAKGVFNKKEVTPEERYIGKTLNFSLLYGATEYSISKTLNVSKEEAKVYVDGYNKAYKGIYNWKNETQDFIAKNGYTKTLYDRRRYLPAGVSPYDKYEKWKYEGSVRQLINHIIQGTCADLLKKCMVELTKKFAEKNLDAYLIATTHDSVMVECREDLIEEVSSIIKETMEITIKGILLPIDYEVKDNFSK